LLPCNLEGRHKILGISRVVAPECYEGVSIERLSTSMLIELMLFLSSPTTINTPWYFSE
jgi:hypothetical protein